MLSVLSVQAAIHQLVENCHFEFCPVSLHVESRPVPGFVLLLHGLNLLLNLFKQVVGKGLRVISKGVVAAQQLVELFDELRGT